MIPVDSVVKSLYEKNDPIHSEWWSFYEIPVTLFEQLRFMAAAAGVDLVWSDSCVFPAEGMDDFVVLKNFAVVASPNAVVISDLALRFAVDHSMSAPYTVEGYIKPWKTWLKDSAAAGVKVHVSEFKENKHFLVQSSVSAVVRLFGEYNTITDWEEKMLPAGLERYSAPDADGAEAYHGAILEEGLDAHVGYLYFLLNALAEKTNSVQDSLFVNRARTSYLPDAVSLFTPFGDVSHPAHVEAVNLFRKQLDSLEEQIQHISSRQEKNELDAMRSHLLFLESKKEASAL